MEFCKAPRAVSRKVFPCFYDFWPPFGTRPESKVGPKSICGATNRSSWRSFTVFYDLFCSAHFFDSILVRFLMKFQCFFHREFPELLIFSQPGDPHETLLFTYREQLFHFWFLDFLHPKMLEIRCQNWTQKRPAKIIPGGTQNGRKCWRNWRWTCLKSAKWSQKVVFGGLDFLVSFGVPKKTQKYRKNGWEGEKSGRPGGMSKPLGRIIGGF